MLTYLDKVKVLDLAPPCWIQSKKLFVANLLFLKSLCVTECVIVKGRFHEIAVMISSTQERIKK